MSKRDRSGESGAEAGSSLGEATPRDLKVSLKDQQLTVFWQDGQESEFSLFDLRRQCPCATCRTERDGQSGNPLRVLKADPDDLRVVSAELVGRYAIQFGWSDGHDTGIFDFRLLRRMATSRPGEVAEGAEGA